MHGTFIFISLPINTRFKKDRNGKVFFSSHIVSIKLYNYTERETKSQFF